MRTREVWKRALAWMLTTAMVVGSSSFAAADEVASDFSAQEETVVAETELSGEEADAPYTDMETPAAEPDIFMPLDEELPEEEQDALVTTDEQDQAGEAQPEDGETATESSTEEISVDNVEIVDHGIETVDEEPGEDGGVPVPTEIAGELEDGSDVEVIFENEGDCKWYTFAPKEEGTYVIYSSLSGKNGDPWLEVYSQDGTSLNYIRDDDDGAGNYNFYMELPGVAGITYYLKLGDYSNESHSYYVHVHNVQRLPKVQSISLEDIGEPMLVPWISDETDVFKRIRATLTYEDSESFTIEGSGWANNSDGLGTLLTYSISPEISAYITEDKYTITASAQGIDSDPVEIEVSSMKEAAEKNPITTESPVDFGENVDKGFAGFTPTETGEYIFSGAFGDIRVYDAETADSWDDMEYGVGHRYELTKDKLYLIAVAYPNGGDSLTLSVKPAREIMSLSFDNQDIECNVLTVGETLMNSITVSVKYEDGTTASAPSFGDWMEMDTDSGIWYYSGLSSEGDRIELTMWDKDQQIDMPTFGRDIVTGTYTLKASCGDKVSQGITFKINPVSISADLTLNESSSVDSDEEGNTYFTFTPDKTGLYKFIRTGGAENEGKIIVYNDKNTEIDYRTYYYEENWEHFYKLKAGQTYIYRVDVGSPESSVNVSIKKMEIALSVEETADRSFPEGYVSICDDVSISVDDGEPEYNVLINDSIAEFYYDYFSCCVRAHLYAVDAFGNPDYAKQIGVESDGEDGEYDLKGGVYARVIELGFYDENYDFVRMSDVEPIIMKVLVQCATHTYETVTVKAATCGTEGSTINRCTVCGYEDSSSVKSVKVTGKHTGGKATCTKKAVCSVCGQEYGALAAHSFGAWKKTSEATVFKKAVQTRSCSVCGKKETQEVGSTAAKIIKLNASSLKMKVKQKTTKLTVTMGPGDSISSVKSSNTKVLKAKVKGGKITLTAQKKTGTAKLTIKLASGVSKTIKVTVQKKAVTTTSIKGVSKKLTLKKKKKTTLKPELNPITSQDKIKYSSSNKKVATVSSKGVVTAKKAGKAIITIKAGKKSFKCTITVK